MNAIANYDNIEFSTASMKMVEDLYWFGRKLKASPNQISQIFGEPLIVKGNTYFWAGQIINGPDLPPIAYFSISNPNVAVGYQENVVSKDWRISVRKKAHGAVLTAALGYRIKALTEEAPKLMVDMGYFGS